MSRKPANIDDINVVIPITWGEPIELPLSEWMKRGPTKRLPLLAPMGAKSRSTGKALPMRVIPMAYRNTMTSRLLIRLHCWLHQHGRRMPSTWIELKERP